MSAKENKDLVRQLWKEANAFNGDVKKIRSWYEKYTQPGFIHHDLSRGDTNAEQRIQATAMMFTAFPDAGYSIDDIVAEADKTSTRYTVRGTHKGAFMGIPPTGKQIAVKGVNIYRFEEGKLAESWDFPDNLGMMAQLGVVPNRTAPK
jgi:steroid delta-isomerase-like uncharacterized protein